MNFERIFFPKIKEEDIGNIWFQQDGATCHTAEDTLDVLHLLKIALSALELMSFGHLGAAIWLGLVLEPYFLSNKPTHYLPDHGDFTLWYYS